ncbi:hypothetical protein ACO0K2_19500 [Undibacterium sp. MH2W]|uniref:hypothetical protein n=1 Tax=Undibacterium sp. MH2W TaxID=3413044 RepID=UPI003BF388B5
MAIKGKPDVTAFLDSGNSTETKSTVTTALPKAEKVTAENRKAKPVLMPEVVFEAIKDHVYAERKKGNKITENQVIVDALVKYLNIEL